MCINLMKGKVNDSISDIMKWSGLKRKNNESAKDQYFLSTIDLARTDSIIYLDEFGALAKPMSSVLFRWILQSGNVFILTVVKWCKSSWELLYLFGKMLIYCKLPHRSRMYTGVLRLNRKRTSLNKYLFS